MMIRVKRIYHPVAEEDGTRFLVDRLWPRGLKKEALRIEAWLKDAAPSDALRRWFGHEASRWQEFRRRYFAELDRKPETWQPILAAVRKGDVTLLYSARDPKHNNATALRDYLFEKLGRH